MMPEELLDEIGKCIRCGFCEATCPTLEAEDYRLYYSPRGRIILVNEFLKNERVDFVDSIYSCLECFLCLETCPAKVNAGKICNYAKRLVAENLNSFNGRSKPTIKLIKNAIVRFGNPLGLKSEIWKWAEGLKFYSNSHTLFYTGGLYQIMGYTKRIINYMKRFYKFSSLLSKFPWFVKFSKFFVDKNICCELRESLRNIVRLLNLSKVEINYRKDEPYPGTLLYELGFVNDFEKHAEMVTDWFKNMSVKRIVTADPHTYYILKEIYKDFVEFDFDVVHYTELINLNFKKSDEVITYHEPCVFSRKCEFYKPNSILEDLSEVVYPRNSGKKSICCGGPVESLFPEITEKISERRFKELKATGASKIITNCPICYVNLKRDDSVTDLASYLIKKIG